MSARSSRARLTELLLRGLGALAPAGEWTLWGPGRVRPFLWNGARQAPEAASALWGQVARLSLDYVWGWYRAV